MSHPWWPAALAVALELNGADVGYAFTGPAALWVHGVPMPNPAALTVEVQWDQFTNVQRMIPPAGPVVEAGDRAVYPAVHKGVPFEILTRYNTVVATNWERVPVQWDGHTVWAIHPLAYRRHAAPGDPLVPQVNAWLEAQQLALSAGNAAAWSQSNYDAWTARHGSPAEAVVKLRKDPAGRLAAVLEHLGDVRGRKVVNLMGSHGAKGVALALLGANATVVDISPENARYARELAREAGVDLTYIVADVLTLPPADYDLVLLELGVLHYFVDLQPLARVVADLLRPGGRFVLQDFHPVSTKLITSSGKKHKVTGNYFEMGLYETPVAYAKHLTAAPPADVPKVRHRRWTLGEIVTAFAQAGLMIRTLDEEPNHKLDDIGLPKTFTLVAEIPGQPS